MEEVQEGESSITRNEDDQQIWSWGAGTDGQLGTGRLQDDLSPQLLNLRHIFSAIGPISMLACGGAHVLALTSGGRVFSWGRGTSGQLGHGETTNSRYPKPVTFFDGYSVSQISAGWSHSGFFSDSGCLFTCGDGSFGQLGHGDYRSHCSPVKVSYFVNDNVEQIACGMRHSLVLLKGFHSISAKEINFFSKISTFYDVPIRKEEIDCLGNQVYAFGSGRRGQLGISKDKIRSVSLPQVTNGFEDAEIVGISANGDHSAALSAGGHLYTWGKGFNSTSDANIPQRLSSSLWFTKAAIGWNHALVLTGDGEVFMLGGSHHGVLSDPDKLKPAKNLSEKSNEGALEKVSGLDGVKVVQIAAGAEHSALVTDNGVIMAWGWGEHGQLGLGNTCDQIYPKTVGLDDEVQSQGTALQIYCGSGFTYAIRTLSPPSQTR